MESALVHRRFAEETERDLVGTLVFRGESGAGRKWNLTTDNCMTTKETEALVEHVHRAALALRTSGRFTKKLGHDRSRGHAFRERKPVLAVTCKHVIVFANCGNRADADRFLTDVKVTETANLAGDIRFRRFLLEAANQKHLPVEFDELIDGQSGVVEPSFLTLFCLVSFAFESLLIAVGRRVDNSC